MRLSEREKLLLFTELRVKYIKLLDDGKIDKLQFRDLNRNIFFDLDLKPYAQMTDFNQALFNYNYYNSKAKYSLELANKFKRGNKQKRYLREENFKLNCYDQKDRATLRMIELEDFKDIEAYPIKLHSKKLKEEIYEINFKARDRVILHSKNEEIKKALIEKNVFDNESRQSLIDSYVNNGA